jgi:hypothetical protein
VSLSLLPRIDLFANNNRLSAQIAVVRLLLTAAGIRQKCRYCRSKYLSMQAKPALPLSATFSSYFALVLKPIITIGLALVLHALIID